MTTQELLEIIQRHNIQAEADKDGDIHFTHEDISMTLLHDDDDPNYISLGAGFEDIDEELHEACYALAAALSQTYKVGKVIVYDDDEGFALRFSVEALVSPEIFDRDLPRYLDIVTEMIADFFDTAAGEDGE
ncbi:hypothetical protein [uncultured Desulfovibrio sp.]|uniref:Uncharacterized protein n=1 Tax=Candidatus Desulfovibrio intestinavium TaxID=2838534 RepID=A0A9D2HQB1_9BACT|nr:hypothetical protein [uncultured Desulfovibrio sp.]HJA79593.1 hypothetical protein [Candidatus Desulfovibrio intestinavium]